MIEFDYRVEAENFDEVRFAVMSRWGNKVYILVFYKELCIKEVLVMDEVFGK